MNLEDIKAENAERKRMRDAATEGEWTNRSDRKTVRRLICGFILPPVARCSSFTDGDFIAFARNDTAPETIDYLVGEVERLRAVVGQLPPLNDRFHDEFCVSNEVLESAFRCDFDRIAVEATGVLMSKDEAPAP